LPLVFRISQRCSNLATKDRKHTNLEDVGRKIDEELKQIVGYLNDEVVPKVRTQSSSALRKAADQLRKLADYMDEHRQRPS
jgi:hypothetical protein